MFDWFDEPMVYYRRFAPMRSGVFDYMSRWMDSVDRAMEDEFGEFFDPFFSHVKPKKAIKGKKEKKQDNKENKKNEEPKKEDTKQDDEEESEPQYYSFSSSMYTDNNGIQHMYREETDSKTGKKKVVETRRIGNKSLTLHRVTDKDGNTEEHETRKNLKDDEVEQFKKDWMSHNIPENSQLPEPKKEENKQIENEGEEKH
jgi:hypothetical protein